MEVDGFPLGIRFLPLPEECIDYLKKKVTSQPLSVAGLFLELYPYNPQQLLQIFSSAEKKGEVYTFTKLQRKGKIGNTNANRRVGNGTWHGDQTFNIPNKNGGTPIGMYHKFGYREKGSRYNHQFVMTEYTLPKGTSLQYDPLKDYVLCRIVKKGWSHNGMKVSKSKRSTNHQVAAVYEQSEPNVDTENPSYSGVGNHQVVAVFKQPEPIAADMSFCGVENPSTSTNFQPFYNDTSFLDGSFSAPLEVKDDLLESLLSLDYKSESPKTWMPLPVSFFDDLVS